MASFLVADEEPNFHGLDGDWGVGRDFDRYQTLLFFVITLRFHPAFSRRIIP
jgi:hypothetical protein